MEASSDSTTEKRRSSLVKIKTEAGVKSTTKAKSSTSGRENRMKGVRKLSCDGSIHKPAVKKSPKITSPNRTSIDAKQQFPGEEPGPLTVEANAEHVADWLDRNRFSSFVKVFQHYSGEDLLKLSRDDLIQICGLADGIRLNNSLQHKQIRPKLTIYVCQRSKPRVRSNQQESSNPSNVLDIGQIHISNQPLSSSTPGCDTRTLAAAIKYSAKQLEEFNVAGFDISNSNPFSLGSDTPSESSTNKPLFNFTPSSSSASLAAAAAQKESKSAAVAAATVSQRSSKAGVSPIDNEQSSDAQGLPPSFTIPQTEMSRGEHANRSPSNSPSPPNGMSPSRARDGMFMVGAGGDAKQPVQEQKTQPKVVTASVTTAKRQFQEEDNSSDSTEYFTKKARTRNLELKRKDIYHAVYLDELSVGELREHLCRLLSVPTACVGEILLQQQSGIHVLVTDHVVHNLPENARYTITGTQDDSVESICYKVELKHVE